MTDLIDRIGPYLGVAAFLGLAILAFLVIQQAREVRRLREWAGRAPERARDSVEAVAAVAEARGEEPEPVVVEEPDPGRFAEWWHGVRASIGERFAALDRRLPVHPRYIGAVLLAAVIAVGVLTSGFGVFGGDEEAATGKGGKSDKPEKTEVAVLNATQLEDTVTGEPIAGVKGLADLVAKKVVRPAAFKIGEKTDAASGFAETVVMFEPEAEAEADELAAKVSDQLGETKVTPMISEVRDLAGKAPLALVIGADDADFGGGADADATADTG